MDFTMQTRETENWDRIPIPLMPRGYSGAGCEIAPRQTYRRPERNKEKEAERHNELSVKQKDTGDEEQDMGDLYVPAEITQLEATIDGSCAVNVMSCAKIRFSRIGREYGLDKTKSDSPITTSGRFVSASELELPMTVISDRDQENRVSMDVLGGPFRQLGEIGLQFELATCTDAASERTIGTQPLLMALIEHERRHIRCLRRVDNADLFWAYLPSPLVEMIRSTYLYITK
jgi:hypothetical protein